MTTGTKVGIGAAVVVVLVFFSFVGCERIDAGHVGVKVDLYGTDKGVQDAEQVTGMVWYLRAASQVYEFPTFVQQAKWANEQAEEGKNVDNSIHCTTSDGMAVSFDVGLNYMVKADKVSDIFQKYRLPLEQIQEQYLRTSVRNAYNSVAGGMTAENIISHRAQYEDSVRVVLDRGLKPEGFIVQQLTILGRITVPQQLERAINAKIEAVQNAQRVENELMQTRAEAAKLEAEATGYANSLMIRAKAESEANRLKQTTLTPLIIQQQLIEKWNGALPQYGTVPQLFRDVTK